MENLFAYGSLMCEDIMWDVSGCAPAGVPGVLHGFRRWSVRGEAYPVIVPDEDGCVEGVIYRDIPDAAWSRLDRFEGEMYLRRPVQVALSAGTTLHAETYVMQPRFLARIEYCEWSLADFLQNGKERFQRDYRGYRIL